MEEFGEAGWPWNGDCCRCGTACRATSCCCCINLASACKAPAGKWAAAPARALAAVTAAGGGVGGALDLCGKLLGSAAIRRHCIAVGEVRFGGSGMR